MSENSSFTSTGAASRSTKKKIAATNRIALIPLRRISASSARSPSTATRDRWGRVRGALSARESGLMVRGPRGDRVGLAPGSAPQGFAR